MRSGDHDAYVILYERHLGAAQRLARQILPNRSDVDDVVAEVFAASFAAIRRGRGPRDAFGPYVLSAVRRECYRSLRRQGRRKEMPAEPDDVERSAVLIEPDDRAERAVLETAFSSLTPRLQTVLWMTEVEGLSHGEIAMRTATTGPAVAAMAMRARRALAEEYLGAHSASEVRRLPQACRDTRRSLAGVVRGTASDRRRRRVHDHLARCAGCVQVHDRLKTVNHRLRQLAPPVLVASLGSTRLFPVGGLRGQWAGWASGHGAAVVAVTGVMTASVVLPSAIDTSQPQTLVDSAASSAAPQVAVAGASLAGADEAGAPTEQRSNDAGSGSPAAGRTGRAGAAGGDGGDEAGAGGADLAQSASWSWLGVELARWLRPITIAVMPADPGAAVPSLPIVTVPPAPTVTVTVPSAGTLPVTVPPLPEVTVPPLPEVTVPATLPVTVTAPVTVAVPDIVPTPPEVTVPATVTLPATPTPPATVPPPPVVTAPATPPAGPSPPAVTVPATLPATVPVTVPVTLPAVP